MYLSELTEQEFTFFASNHVLKSYHQSTNYAKLMEHHGFTKEYIGLFDHESNLIGASLIIIKSVFKLTKYGYAPKGLLMDYYNKDIINNFASLLKEYYLKRNIAFIRINPEISIGTVNYKDNQFITNYNTNSNIANNLTDAGFTKIETKGFNSILPKFNAIIRTNTYNLDTISKHHRSEIIKAKRKGLYLEKGNFDDIKTLFELIKKKKNRPLNYYEDYYNQFRDNIDVFLVKINYKDYLLNVRKLFEEEQNNNQALYQSLILNNNQKHLIAKMESDRLLDEYKQEIIEATNGMQNNEETVVAGAMAIRFDNRVNIIISGYNKKYKSFSPNYLLHDAIINYYKKDYKYIELNGITGNSDKKYKGLNEFKLGFNPDAFEFIGEYDLIINPIFYRLITLTDKLKKDFKK